MKQIVRLVVALVLAVGVLSAGLTGCGEGNGTKPSGDSGQISTDNTAQLAAEKGKKLTIMIPGHNPKSTDAAAWQNPVVEKFKTDYPDVSVEFVVAGWDTWETKLLANISANDPVDVLNDGANNNPKFALKGITQPLEKFVNLQNKNLHKTTMDSVFRYDNHYYVAVSETNVAVIFYNKYIFENEGADDPQQLYEAGDWDWEHFTQIAKELTDKKSKRWGFATNYPYIFFGANATSMLTLNNKYEYQLNINSAAIKNALELMRDGWYSSGWSGWENDPWSTFYNGSAAMLGDFQWVDRQITEAKEYGLADFDFGVVPMPTGPDNKDGVSPITAAGWAIGAGSDCPYHAGALIDRLVDGQTAYSKTINAKIDATHVKLYETLAKKPYCTNSYDSAVNGAFEICQAVGAGESIAQSIEKFKPVYQRLIDEANNRNTKLTAAPTTTTTK